MKNKVIHLYDKYNVMDTLCGKVNTKIKINITKNPKEVTCCSCLRSKNFPSLENIKNKQKEYKKIYPIKLVRLKIKQYKKQLLLNEKQFLLKDKDKDKELKK